MKHERILSTLVILIFSLILLTGCGSKKDNENRVTAVGSTALQPLAEQAAMDYNNIDNKINITVQGGGSGTGLSQVEQNAVNIGDSDIFAQQKTGINFKKLIDNEVAVVGIAPIANKSTGVNNLSINQLAGIFTGKIKNWKEVGGNNIPIIVINRSQGSGSRSTFERVVLHGKSAINSQAQDSSGTVQKIVANTPGAVSYLAFPYLNKNFNIISLNHIKPSYNNVTSNKWKIWSYEHMYTNLNPNQGTKKFINYIKLPSTQNSLVKAAGYISIYDMKYKLNPDGKVVYIKEKVIGR